eukprot:12936077-Prorocentrum_lima.AAC.1
MESQCSARRAPATDSESGRCVAQPRFLPRSSLSELELSHSSRREEVFLQTSRWFATILTSRSKRAGGIALKAR